MPHSRGKAASKIRVVGGSSRGRRSAIAATTDTAVLTRRGCLIASRRAPTPSP